MQEGVAGNSLKDAETRRSDLSSASIISAVVPSANGAAPRRITSDDDNTVSVLDQLSFRKPVRQHVKEFACLMSCIMLLIAAVFLYKGSRIELGLWLSLGAVILTVVGYQVPIVLYPIWKGWMFFAEKLGLVMSFIVLTIAWIIMVTPLALVLKLVGKRVINLSFRESVNSYWEPCQDSWIKIETLKRQF